MPGDRKKQVLAPSTSPDSVIGPKPKNVQSKSRQITPPEAPLEHSRRPVGHLISEFRAQRRVPIRTPSSVNSLATLLRCPQRPRPVAGNPGFLHPSDQYPSPGTRITAGAWSLPAAHCWPGQVPRCRSGSGFRTWTCSRLPPHSRSPAPHSAPKPRSLTGCSARN